VRRRTLHRCGLRPLASHRCQSASDGYHQLVAPSHPGGAVAGRRAAASDAPSYSASSSADVSSEVERSTSEHIATKATIPKTSRPSVVPARKMAVLGTVARKVHAPNGILTFIADPSPGYLEPCSSPFSAFFIAFRRNMKCEASSHCQDRRSLSPHTQLQCAQCGTVRA